MIVPLFFCLLVLFITTSKNVMEPFIQGGGYAKIENFPHSVYLYMVCSEHQSCGGSILTQQIILTAGHCFEQCFKHSSITAFAGGANTEAMAVAQSITKFRIHKYYKPKSLYNDIALGLVESAIPLTDTMKRTIIASNFPKTTMARVAGWGVTSDKTLEQTQNLKMVTQILQSKNTCREIVRLHRGMMCALNSVKNHPTQGDSGSALVTNNGRQIGLVSWRHTYRKDVVIYTNVSDYYHWIHTQAGRLLCSNKVK